MTVFPATWAFLGVLAPALLAGLWWLSRAPSARRAVLLLAGLQSLGGGLALVLGEDSFGVLRLGCWSLFAVGGSTLAASAFLLRRHSGVVAALAALAAVALAAVAVDAFLVEPVRLDVARHRIESPRISRPLRIVALADTQTDIIDAHQKRAWKAALDERPDLVLLLGDYVQIREREARLAVLEQLRAYLASLDFRAPLGVIAVRGNVDYRDWGEGFRGLPVELVSRSRRIERAGLVIDALSVGDSFTPTLALAPVPEGSFHLVLGHGPDYALGALRADLMLAGHCHGGQVRLPWLGPPLTLSGIPRAWTSGLTAHPGGGSLIVSRGIGMERNFAPRLRFLCTPEVVVIDLVPAAPAAPAADASGS